MKRYSIIHIPVLSFFSKALYRDVRLEWQGTCFPFLLLLLTVCWIPPMVELHRSFSDFVRNDAPGVLSQVPQISIAYGTVIVDAPQPYFIKDPETLETLFILDTTGTYTNLKETEALGLLTASEVIVKKSDVETRTFNVSNIEQLTLNKQKISGWLETARRYAAVTIFPFAVAGSFVFRIVQVLIYALLGMLMASLCKTQLLYLSLVRLSVVAITPCIIVRTMLGIFDFRLPYAGLWFFIAAMTYLFLAVRESAKKPGNEQGTLNADSLHG